LTSPLRCTIGGALTRDGVVICRLGDQCKEGGFTTMENRK
jgi:hypothetical protein